jgi:hypothetical protein
MFTIVYIWHSICTNPVTESAKAMGQEVSVSYQAVKSKVYKLIDAMVEDIKTQGDVQESMNRWWKLVHPADRPIARKYLLSVLEKSNATLDAIANGLLTSKDFDPAVEASSLKLQRLMSHSQTASLV